MWSRSIIGTGFGIYEINTLSCCTIKKRGEQFMNYIAHKNEITGQIQTVKEHSENTANLCREYAISELKDFLYAIGLLHDVGKYQESFGKRISGENIRVEHSTCGALAAKDNYAIPAPMALMMEYCIAGHHSGIPDGGFPNDDADKSTLCGRLTRDFEDYSEYKKELSLPELDGLGWMKYLFQDCDNQLENVIDKFAFLTRYVFSCLVDADSNDTAEFCKEREFPRKLNTDFTACLQKVNARLDSFVCRTELQKTRALLQNQAFQNAGQDGDIYLLNMPTGSGKTLASIKIALERAVQKEKKRIIYIIPYNSIIEQTADVFENLFGEDMEILRHQSTFSYEDEENGSEDYRMAAKTAAENWDAPFIITTAVQFFESVYANKRGKLRKMHNMSDSILIFDEAHLMPQNYLQPCLQAVAYITRYLHSEAVFLTATMPDFEKLLNEYALPDCKIVRLIKDTAMFAKFQKCKYSYIGEVTPSELLARCCEYPSSLIIVNKKATARKLYQECDGKKYHLSTYMTSYDRKKILREIRQELHQLELDYPEYKNVPENRRITIISTSLIEAGVDLDVYTVFRERAGLDSILQAGGRCNREGKREIADVFVFDLSEDTKKNALDEKANLTKGLLEKYKDISDVECVDEYYSRLYFMRKEDIQKNTMHRECTDIASIPFKEYAEKFELIDSRQVSLVVPRDVQSEKLVEIMKYTKEGNVRKLQNYTCSVRQKELEDLIRQHVVDDYGTGIYCLTNMDYYDEYIGVLFEASDYFL